MMMAGKIDRSVLERLRPRPQPAAAVSSVREQVDMARHAIRAVAQGRKPMQLIGSEPGLGKTYITLQELRRLGIKVENVAPANPSAFVKTLFDHRNDEVLVLDDCDARPGPRSSPGSPRWRGARPGWSSGTRSRLARTRWPMNPSMIRTFPRNGSRCGAG